MSCCSRHEPFLALCQRPSHTALAVTPWRPTRAVARRYDELVASTQDPDPAAAISDAELTMIALAADPNPVIADDAVPFGGGRAVSADLLPEWYMPAPQRSAADRSPARVFTVSLIVAALLLLNGAGLCVTYGLPEIAW